MENYNKPPKYYFNQLGSICSIAYPSKVILKFSLNGREEKAVLLFKNLTVDGKTFDERICSADYLKENELIEFDCHIYNTRKIPPGYDKDNCNYFAVKGWKYSPECKGRFNNKNFNRNSIVIGTGYVQELNPKKGVLTFEHEGEEGHVVFLASKFWYFGSRLNSKQILTDVLNKSDPVQFEAVFNDDSSNQDSNFNWFANLVWKGKRPSFEEYPTPQGYITYLECLKKSKIVKQEQEKEQEKEKEMEKEKSKIDPEYGLIGKVVDNKWGVIWKIIDGNQIQSVFFYVDQITYEKEKLSENLREGATVVFKAEKSSRTFPTMWVAKDVVIKEIKEK